MNNWKTIETAPKDGTWVMLCGGTTEEHFSEETISRVVSAQWTTYLNWSDGLRYGRWQFAWFDGGYYGAYRSPTHWMPLLSLPNVAVSHAAATSRKPQP